LAENAFRVEQDVATRAAIIRFTRPDDGNRLSLRDIAALAQSIREHGARREVHLVILRGDGEDFCLGRAAGPAGEVPKAELDVRNIITQPILDVYESIRAAPVPVLAMVQGRASGFGCALVAQCDLAIAAEDATFSLPEMDQHLPPTLAISTMLHRVPLKRILHMVYTREVISAAEALAHGIIGRIVPLGGLEDAAQEVARKLSDRNRAAVSAVKLFAVAALYEDANGAARRAGNMLAAVLSSQKQE
jgi:enoyl-CoA hydratase/carnithine racemase